ncbi:MAG: hypothetical protein LC130_10815 [Bryobacterales bacterium]|nr:hypothetical protein [Bryobacterales bacterium]
MLWTNIPKQRGSTVTSENGALLECLSVPTSEWQDDYATILDQMAAQRDLSQYKEAVNQELRSHPHSSMSDLRPVFGRFCVHSLRGYYQIRFDE